MRYARCIASFAIICACSLVAHAQDSVRLTSDEVEGVAAAFERLKRAAKKDDRAAFILQHLRRYHVDVDRQNGRFVVWFEPAADLLADSRAREARFLFQRQPLELIKISYGR